jgi:carboxypeptidase family protein
VGAKGRLLAAIAAAAVLLWFGLGRLERPARGERALAAAEVAEPEREPAELEPAAGVASPAVAEAPVRESVAGERAPAPGSSPAPRKAPRGEGTLLVRVVKRHAGVAPHRTRLYVTGSSLEGNDASDLFEGRMEPLAEAMADGSGRARLVVPAGRSLWLSADPGRWERAGPASDRELEHLQRATLPLAALAPGEEREVLVEIEHGPDRTLEGQVVAAEDGRPLPGATIDGLAVPEGLTADARGSFALPYSSWDPPPSVRVAHEGFTPRVLRPQWLDQAPGGVVVIALERPAVIVARIEGLSVEGARLEATDEENGELEFAQALLDEHGRCELGVAASLALRLALRTADDELLWHSEEPWTLSPGERRELVLQLGNGTLVQGFLRDEAGQPLPDEELWAVSTGEESVEGRTRYLQASRGDARVARTDARGGFEFSSLPAGSWWLGPASSSTWAAQQTIKDLAPSYLGIELRGESARRVDLVAHRGLWIEGRVEDEEGHRLSGIHVRAEDPGRGEAVQAYSGDGGAFTLGPLAPGEHQLRLLGGDGFFGWPADTVAVEAGARDVVLVLRSVHSIGGRVVEPGGRAADARVHLLQRSGSLGQGTSSENPGAFRFLGLEPGEYSVQAEAPDGRVAVRNVELAEGGRVDGVELVLAEGARIGVKHAFDHGVRCSIFSEGVLAADSTVSPGEESFETVPAGRLRVELYDGSGILAMRELVGRAGRVESIHFE